jgi:uncharacterized surface protein with fasciclin (FAS1) repeats/Cu/Zn superoxide dismutase
MKMKLVCAVFGATLAAATLTASQFRLVAEINEGAETVPTGSPATGRAVMHIDTTDLSYHLTINLQGLENELTGSHIHEGAPGQDGGVVEPLGGADSYFTLNGFYAAEFEGTYGGNLGQLLAGNAYLNFHTNQFPAGEIRGQLMLAEEETQNLVNLSTRGMVDPQQSAASVLISGFVIAERPRQVLIRGVGESLADFNVPNALADVTLRVFDADGQEIAANDNWETGGLYKVRATGFAPDRASEAAVVMNLQPGIYTAHLGSRQGAGIGLVELYSIEALPLAETLTEAEGFGTLLAALEAAELVMVLAGPGPFTLFAPTDAAFAALGQGVVDNLLLPANREQLANILLYHVVPGEVYSTDLEAGPVNAITGDAFNVTIGETVQVNDATVIEADIRATNGVIHVIDRVLLPPQS